jgi:hypothetical protein
MFERTGATRQLALFRIVADALAQSEPNSDAVEEARRSAVKQKPVGSTTQ